MGAPLLRVLGVLALTLFLGGGLVSSMSSAKAEEPLPVSSASVPAGPTTLDPLSTLTPAASSTTELVVALPETLILSTEGVDLQTQLQRLNRALERSAQPYHLRVSLFQASDAESQLAHLKPDFVIAQPSLLIGTRSASALPGYALASRKVNEARDAAHSVGGVILALKSRHDLNDLADLRGKVVTSTMPLSTGWLAVLGEVAKHGDDPDTYFRSVHFLTSPMPNVVSALLSGHTDVAVMDSCQWEHLLSQRLVEGEAVKVIHERTDEQLACRRSTDLYSDATLYAFEWTDERAVRAVLSVLLQGSHSNFGEWHVHVSRQAMDELMKTLRLGPYHYLRELSFQALVARYGYELAGLGALLMFLLLNELRLNRLVRRRTAELSQALQAQQESEKAAKAARLRLGSLERRNVVNQMSAMIAHEVRTPLGAIMNFVSVLQMLRQAESPSDRATSDVGEVALSGIIKETERIGGIVDRVRQYAKSQRTAHVSMDLVNRIHEALRVLQMTYPETIQVDVRLLDVAPMLGDPLEVELLVFNLLKNAVEATQSQPPSEPRYIALRLEQEGETKYALTIENSGEHLSEEALAKLGRSIDSVKPEGLGMGLSIVRGIADSHAAQLHFRARAEGGLMVRCLFHAQPATPAEPTTKGACV